jgi:hypothetical protein
MSVWTRGAYQNFSITILFRAMLTALCIRMLKDDRVQGDAERSIFNVKDAADRLG